MKTIYIYAPFGKVIDSYCADAMIGAYQKGIDVKFFTDIEEVPRRKDIMVVGDVKDTQKWFGVDIPCIDFVPDENDPYLDSLKGRKIQKGRIWDVDNFPVFVKPLTEVKSFTGTVFETKDEFIHNVIDDIELMIQDVIHFDSEYRVFISNGIIVGVKHYLGDYFVAADRTRVNEIKSYYNSILDVNSYTLDIGVNTNGTYLIEVNDGWSVDNYGLDPVKYLTFLQNRWLQLIENYF